MKFIRGVNATPGLLRATGHTHQSGAARLNSRNPGVCFTLETTGSFLINKHQHAKCCVTLPPTQASPLVCRAKRSAVIRRSVQNGGRCSEFRARVVLLMCAVRIRAVTCRLTQKCCAFRRCPRSPICSGFTGWQRRSSSARTSFWIWTWQVGSRCSCFYWTHWGESDRSAKSDAFGAFASLIRAKETLLLYPTPEVYWW